MRFKGARAIYRARSQVRRINVKGKLKTQQRPCKYVVAYDEKSSTLNVQVPIFLKSPNAQVHFRTQMKINERIGDILLKLMPKEMQYITLPCKITFIRIAPRRLDSDNNCFAFKYVRDFLCSYLRPGLKAGRADTEDYFQFDYGQERGEKGEYGIKIIFQNL